MKHFLNIEQKMEQQNFLEQHTTQGEQTGGIEILGTPIGNTEYRNQYIKEKKRKSRVILTSIIKQ